MYIEKEHEVFKALSEPIRLRIVNLLLDGELCVCDLESILGLPQSTISRHMTRLKYSNLVIDRRDGRWIYYRLNLSETSILSSLKSYFESLGSKEPYKEDLKQRTIRLNTKKCD